MPLRENRPRMKTMYESSKSGFFRFKKRGEKKAA